MATNGAGEDGGRCARAGLDIDVCSMGQGLGKDIKVVGLRNQMK